MTSAGSVPCISATSPVSLRSPNSPLPAAAASPLRASVTPSVNSSSPDPSASVDVAVAQPVLSSIPSGTP